MSSKIFHRQYYFTFGSNMSLTQMAERCPGSTFIGKATLRGYKWQINQRHVANIVKVTEGVSSGPAGQADVVEGLVFSITDKDRRTLDRKEGIKLGVYERVVLNVFLERHPNLTEKKTAFVRDRLQDKPCDIGENAANLQPKLPVLSKRPPPSVRSPAAEVEEIEAITYLSTKYAEDGLIRLEYVQRMENAIHDAVKLDVSRDFVERYLEPYINGDVYQPEEDVQEKPSTSNPSVSQTVCEERKMKAKGGPVLHSAAAQKPDHAHRAHHTRKRSHGANARKQPLRGEDRESRRAHPRIGEEEPVSRKERDKEPAGFWSSMSSMFGSGQSQGTAKSPQDR
ncbi:AIG2-like family domain-containing protein [Penicillium canescens]|uniref:gamma-glutamylcyclotransferase n=1 Tax=Penicillium canescens TaxID=5083 RepID=A0AAD6N7L9_PENCN|nr:AIG2-like family domain-containing protein [Penicillium canescens]KAJ6038464.1 AIG2-like family domain-containing protein [Penicillium canescens]KAJ6039475.1 AIG2-like family domain-containing protein [Penicillium canescens]KAJ6068231.1 AIG2-like family domain-containing protein [Penicillium canescens]KAJ6084810.1 AIG2-like family domain-containing protein [Penicillium canescens]